MKIVAPLILTLGLSFLLYSTTDVWPKSDYDGKTGPTASQTRQRGGGASYGGMGLEEGLDQYRSRKDFGSPVQPFQYGKGGQGSSAKNPLDISGGGNR